MELRKGTPPGQIFYQFVDAIYALFVQLVLVLSYVLAPSIWPTALLCSALPEKKRKTIIPATLELQVGRF